ncbi:FAD-dependent oxidoreductase [Streptomyces sp. NPDC014685]|uniref:FAD-dependent oxidoreductase n=1 Tax=Streptomyces sp. NPDC014685 TaxID=3364881 RepID=UPI0036F7E4B8
MPDPYGNHAMPPTTTTTGPLPTDGPPYDVTVVGAGVVGTAIARHRLRIALLDASDDIGNATSKANTAILHTGFDAVPGFLEARPVREGQHLLRTYAAGANIPVERVGALLVAWDEEQLAVLPALLTKAVRNEHHAARLLDAEELYAREPRLGPGARERPRSARLVPGSRPPGVCTTGELQQAVHLYRQRIGTRAVVIGDEPVGRAAVDTLRVAGADVVAVVTDRPHSRLAAPTRSANHPPVLDDTTVTALTGRQRLTGVAVRHRDGRTTTLRCDTVVFTGDWVPDHELARRGAITLDPGTRGPAYDAAHRTTRNGVFAVGNLLHGVESAAFAAAEGRAVAAPLLRHLATGAWPRGRPPVTVAAPLHWIAPNLVGPDGDTPTHGRFSLRTTRRLSSPLLVVRQDGRMLHRQRLLRPAVPGLPFHLRAHWPDRVDPGGGTVRIEAN